MLESAEWRHVVEAIPADLADLRPPASEGRIRDAEKHLGRTLPPSFRSFLLVRDGGRIGDLLILGTPELSTLNKAALPENLIPFHPVSTTGDFECFDASREKDGELAVVWYLADRDVSEQTYEDFTDWLLDQLIDLKLP